MHRFFLTLVAVGCALCLPGSAQTPANLRMYVLDCGVLLNRTPTPYGLTSEQVGGVTELADPCFLLVHGNQTLLWDTGIDEVAERRAARFQKDRLDKPLKAQLTELGYPPSKITYLALSHLHGDHAGNANDYAASTWIVQKAERDYMFREGLPDNINSKEFGALQKSKAVVVEGNRDHDVFGDGSVVLIATPGHSPGHQSLFVKLAQTGPIVLSGDLYHFPAERTFKKVPAGDFDAAATAASREKLEAFLMKTGAKLWIQHDTIGNKTLKKAPAFYE